MSRRSLVLGLPGLILAVLVVAWLALQGDGGRRRVEDDGRAGRAPTLSGRGEPTVGVDSPEDEADLASLQATWTGRVLDADGRGLAGARVIRESLLVKRRSAGSVVVADETGTFRMTAPQGQGTMALYAAAAGFLPSRLEVPRRGKTGLVFRLERDRRRSDVAIEVVTESGEPAAGVAGWAVTTQEDLADPNDPNDLEQAYAFDWVTRGAAWTWVDFRTDAEGRAVLPARLPGLHRVRAVQDGRYLDAEVRVEAPPRENRHRLAMARARRVTATVRVRRDSAWACTHETHRFEAWAETEGWKRVGAFGEGERVTLDVAPAIREVLVETLGHPPARLRLPAGGGDADLGEVSVADARPVSGRVRYADGRAVARATLRYGDWKRAWTTTDADGRFVVDDLPRPSRRDRVTLEIPGRAEPISLPADLSAEPLEIALPADATPPAPAAGAEDE